MERRKWALLMLFLGIALLPARSFAAIITWDGGGGDGNWTTSANWSGDIVPTSTDSVLFSASSTGDVSIDASTTVAGLEMAAGYSGTITQGDGTVFVLNGPYTQADGTFTGSLSGTFDLNNGDFIISSGTFSSAGTTSFERNLTITAPGIFQNNTGLLFDDSDDLDDSTLNCYESIGLVRLRKDHAGLNGFTIGSGCGVSINNATSTFVNAGITNDGAITYISSSWSMFASLVNNGTVSHNGSSWAVIDGGIKNNSSGTINFGGTLSVEKDFDQKGAFNMSQVTLTLEGEDAEDSGILSCTSPIGSLTIGKSHASATLDILDCTVSGDLSWNDGTVQATTTTSTLIVWGSVALNSTTSDTFGNEGFTLIFGSSTSQNISQATGTIRTSMRVEKAGGMLSLTSPFSVNGTCNVASGSFALDGNALTCSAGFIIGGSLVLHGDENIPAGNFQSGSTVIFTGNGDSNPDEYDMALVSGTFHNLNVSSTDAIDEFTFLSGTLDVEGSFGLSGGIFIAPTGTFALAGNWNRSGGTFIHSTSTITLDGGSQAITGENNFYGLTKTVSSTATFTLPAGNTTTFEGELSLAGSPGNLLLLRSSGDGSQARIDPRGTSTLQYLDVKDIRNSGAIISCMTGCVDSGNNFGWNLPQIVVNGGGGGGGGGGGFYPQPTTPAVSSPLRGVQELKGHLESVVLGYARGSITSGEFLAQLQWIAARLSILARATGGRAIEVPLSGGFERDLEYGMENDNDIKRLQEVLGRAGFYRGPVTGNFYQLTRAAVLRFQRTNGINPTGYVGPVTRRALSALN